MDIFEISIFVFVILNLSLGLIVFLVNPKSRLNRLFAVSAFLTALWILVNLMMGIQKTEFWLKSAYTFGPLVAFSDYLWMAELCEMKRSRMVTIFLGVLSLFFSILPHINGFLVSGVKNIYLGGFDGETGKLFVYYFGFVSFIFILIIYTLIAGFLRSKGLKKNQISYVVVGTTLYIFSVVVTSFIFPLFGYFKLVPFDSPSSFFLLFFTSLAITRYHLFDLKIILTEILVSLIIIILMVQALASETVGWAIFNVANLMLFCVFGYYLVRATQRESQWREEVETIAAEESALREEAEKLASDLKRLDEAKTQFILSAQHHLRGPLTVVQGYLCLLAEGSYGRINAKAMDKIKACLDENQKMVNVVNDFLDVARYRMGKGGPQKTETDIALMIREIVDDLVVYARTKELYLEFEEPNGPVPAIMADRPRLKEAFYNIIDNAIKYTEQGGVKAKIEGGTGKLKITITDTGIGMEGREKNNVFDRTFERGERAKKVYTTGKGIGLYLAAQIIFSHGGSIRVESGGKDKGSAFFIELPIGKSEENAELSGNGEKKQ